MPVAGSTAAALALSRAADAIAVVVTKVMIIILTIIVIVILAKEIIVIVRIVRNDTETNANRKSSPQLLSHKLSRHTRTSASARPYLRAKA